MPLPTPSAHEPPNSLVFVLGMHRSGTSMLTRILNLLGLETSDRLLEASVHNRTGYWESKAVTVLNDRILTALDSAWYDPRPLSIKLLTEDACESFLQDATELIRDELSGNRSAVLKDPRLCRTAPLWFEAARRAGYVPKSLCMIRDPAEVMASLNRRNRLSETHTALLCQSYTIELEVNSRTVPRYCVHDQRVIENWRSELLPALKALGLSELMSDSEAADEIDAYINPGERHYSAPSDPPLLPDEALAATRIYELFARNSDMSALTAFDLIIAEWKTYWDAKAKLGEAIDYQETLPQGFMEKSRHSLEHNEPEKALDWLAKGIMKFPEEPALCYRAGHLLLRLKRAPEAISHFERAIEINPEAPEYYGLLTRAYLDVQRPDDALAAIRKALEMSPDSPVFLNLAGKVFVMRDDLPSARNAFQTLLDVDKSNAAGYAGMGEVMLLMGELENARRYTKKAVKLASDTKPYRKLARRTKLALVAQAERSGNE